MSLEIMNVEDATHVGATALRSTADVNPSHDHSVVKIMLAQRLRKPSRPQRGRTFLPQSNLIFRISQGFRIKTPKNNFYITP